VFDAGITVDESGFVLADGGMNATLRDLGRFGLLVLAGGIGDAENWGTLFKLGSALVEKFR